MYLVISHHSKFILPIQSMITMMDRERERQTDRQVKTEHDNVNSHSR